jgi:hypothetical protein
MARGARTADHLNSQACLGMGTSRREPMDALEVRDVLLWKQRMRASWQACAAFCGRPEADVRRACEGLARAATIASPPLPPLPPPVEVKVVEVVSYRPVTTRTRLRAGLTPGSQADRVLNALAGCPMTAPELAGVLAMHRGNLSPTLSKMLAAGLIATRSNPNGRGYLYHLPEPTA